MDLADRPKTPDTSKSKSVNTSPVKPQSSKLSDWPGCIISSYLM